MKIQFNNVGKIKMLDFELKNGLTLFCGPNNTGKTYAAYGIFNAIIRLRQMKDSGLLGYPEKIDSLLSKGIATFDLNNLIHSDNFTKEISEKISLLLSNDFDAPNDFFKKECIQIKDAYTLAEGSIEEEISFENELWKFICCVKEGVISISIGSPEALNHFAKQERSIQDFKKLTLQGFLGKIISENFIKSKFNEVYVLTAERAAINLFSRELSSSRINLIDQLLDFSNSDKNAKNFDLVSFINKKAKRYSLPIREGLKIAEDLKEISKNISDFSAFANKLENQVLGGQIQVGEYGELSYRQEDASRMRMNLAASMVKSLASLVVYLRHQATRGDVLIIDEPELNLHPDSQRKIARFLCELTNAGLNIIISTHSDYIIREVNNCILLKHPILQDVKERYHYQENQLIASEKVSVVLFNDVGLPQQLPVTPKGFTVESIDAEIRLLNQLADDIAMEWEE